jgi:O-antigen/teichoic acid export membrane protein
MKGSTLKRVLSGSIAGWVRIAINLGVQLVATPIFLANWSAETYGLWLLFLTFSGVLQIFDTGHQAYMENEFLRIGPQNKPKIEEYLSSSIPIALFIALLELISVFLLIMFGGLQVLGIENEQKSTSFATLLILHSICWLVFGSVGGLLVRVATAFGYYSLFAWWGMAMQLLTATVPLIIVLCGGSFFAAGLGMLSAVLVINIAMVFSLVRIFRVEELSIARPSLNVGLRNFAKSLILIGDSVVDFIRQNGIRLVLSPLAGTSQMAMFATTRTGANVVLQGLGTITGPIKPELMRFIGLRDQSRIDSCFATLWIVVTFILSPAMVILQTFIGQFFEMWTRGKIPFDPFLFGVLSLSVLVSALAQPALTVVHGNNLLRARLLLSTFAGIIVIGCIFCLVPLIGIRGAGLALLFGELSVYFGASAFAKRWIHENGLRWPNQSGRIAFDSVLIVLLACIAIVLVPSLRLLWLGIAMFLFSANGWRYYCSLPLLAVSTINNMVMRPFGVEWISAKRSS